MRLLFLFSLFLPGLLSAATFTVTSTADTSDPGTLRWAIEQHNASGGTNVIDFSPSLAGQTILFTNPAISGHFPTITKPNLRIDGSAAPGLTIDRNGGARIFILSAGGFITIENIRLTNARGVFGGSCVRASNSTQLIQLINVTFDGCETRQSGTADAIGGAIFVEFNSVGNGQLVVRDSLFINNKVEGSQGLLFGGAIYAENNRVTIERTRFELNIADNFNSAFHQGGAVYISNADEVQMVENEFLFNQAEGGAGGAVVMNLLPSSSAFVRRNLFAGNVADLGSAVWTGTQVLGDDVPFFNFTNNTFFANTTSGSTGGALFLREGDAIVRSNSFIQNSNASSGGAHLAYNVSRTSFLSIWNNLFGPAASAACDTTSGSPGVFPSAGYNVLPDASCAFSGLNDMIGNAGPFLPLGDYGGITRLVPPAAGNLAIDTGNPAPIGPGNVALCPEFDARGQARPGDGDADGMAVCDVGAFEWSNEAPLFFDGFEETGLVFP